MLEFEENLEQYIIKHTAATRVVKTQHVQTLWSGYGEIKRYVLEGSDYASVIVKHIRWPDEKTHPRGWNTPLSHQRKLRSYQVEKNWYDRFSVKTNRHCKVPIVNHVLEKKDELLLIMEDLDRSGFSLRLDPTSVQLHQAQSVLSWLAHFHATFMEAEPTGLWSTGTYWHLETRPEEWENMQNSELKLMAKNIDQQLKDARFQTLVHGDAKLANFCFSESDDVAAVDFQYVGKGCGMKDVAYFISSCFEEEDCEKYEDCLLNHYFEELRQALEPDVDFEALREEWQRLYAYAWADFYRFLDGWSPGHWKMHIYSEKITQEVMNELKRR